MRTLDTELTCFHCGETCDNSKLAIDDKYFCCSGCRSVYLLLNSHKLDNYYCLNEVPGQKVGNIQPEKFRYLDDENIARKLLTFSNNTQSSVTFYLPQIHCSSCLWLLEHLQKIDDRIIAAHVNFSTKEISITFNNQLSLRKLAELLTSIGYEPHISLQDTEANKTKTAYSSKKAAYKLGIAGFCFANIMLISFPEYLGMETHGNKTLVSFFRTVNVLLSFPVVFYCAKEFFVNAWYSYKQKYLNIDAPIALAIAVTFIRSLYEVISGTGAGYFDSMTGIVFFMLLGRTLQNRTYSTLSFSRDYKSYFPIAVTSLRNGEEHITKIQDIKEHDILLLHHEEVVPADCILSKGTAEIDYSFITGESVPERILPGGLIYAGGKNKGAAIEVVVVKDFQQNNFIRLWNNKAFNRQQSDREAMTTIISKYFSFVVLTIAFGAFAYWQVVNPQNAWNALTAVLIVACPCALLLNATFTNGYLISYFADKGFFIKNAAVIEEMSQTNHIAFDKTGTITEASTEINVKLMKLNTSELKQLLALTAQSLHPLSRAIVGYYKNIRYSPSGIIKELSGKGIEGWIDDSHWKIGSGAFVLGQSDAPTGSEVYVSIDGQLKAHFIFSNSIKSGVKELLSKLKPFTISIISGDTLQSSRDIALLFDSKTQLHFQQTPQQKLAHIESLQQEGKKVMMVGDGLNDAGALQQSNTGVAIVERSFSFSPACDAIMEARHIQFLPDYIQMAKGAQRIILFGFLYSIVFNIIGVTIAVTGNMSPMIAAILMPSSSLGIMLIAYIGIKIITKRARKDIDLQHLDVKPDENHISI
jgi:Cu+-exporting ATPase